MLRQKSCQYVAQMTVELSRLNTKTKKTKKKRRMIKHRNIYAERRKKTTQEKSTENIAL